MRVLGIETSGQQGSVALVEHGRVVHLSSHGQANRHAEETLPLVERALAELGWAKTSLDRVAVGRGPGSFTGLRVGLAVASGLRLGLGLEAIGLGSLRIAAACARIDAQGELALGGGELLLVQRDARREEFFVALYDDSLTELRSARTIPRQEAPALTTDWVGPAPHRVVTSEPDARGAALLGALALAPSEDTLSPEYVRDAGATPQSLLPSPLSDERRR